MTRLKKLKAASSLHAFADVLGYKAKGLAYIIHGIHDSKKYKDFEIKKRSGGLRKISAPIPELKRLQKSVAHLLEDCVSEINSHRKTKGSLCHGFRPKHSIMTNAAIHRKKRYIFNIDLQDFFGTIHFGRVWRFFERNRDFALDSSLARTIAQIACHNRALPQGSPCSPSISNLIGHILDVRMAKLAAQAGCQYSRYADDLTFSTNRKNFPPEIAQRVGDTNLWVPGKQLANEIKRCRFEINPAKTRMQFKDFRQDVTGIVVNSKLNIRAEYAKNVRAMVHSLVTKGGFTVRKTFRDEAGAWIEEVEAGTEARLRGMLSFIDSVRCFELHRQTIKKSVASDSRLSRRPVREMDRHERVYRQFLLFSTIFRPLQPLVICEGKTDNVYLRCALQKLSGKYPKLVNVSGAKITLQLNFFNYSNTTDRILHLGGGTGDLAEFIGNYGAAFKGFKYSEKRRPVIVVIDNDSGAQPIFAAIKKATFSKSAIDGSLPYYHIRDNLYVVPVPKQKGKETAIEDFFEKAVLDTKLGGKEFSRQDKFDPAAQYGKHLFSEHVVKKNKGSINFDGFEPVLDRIVQVLDAHSVK